MIVVLAIVTLDALFHVRSIEHLPQNRYALVPSVARERHCRIPPDVRRGVGERRSEGHDLLVARQIYGWRGRRAAKLTLEGFACALAVLIVYLIRRLVG